jgi:hypothetical protein
MPCLLFIDPLLFVKRDILFCLYRSASSFSTSPVALVCAIFILCDFFIQLLPCGISLLCGSPNYGLSVFPLAASSIGNLLFLASVNLSSCCIGLLVTLATLISCLLCLPLSVIQYDRSPVNQLLLTVIGF